MMRTIVFLMWSLAFLFAEVSHGAVTTYTNFSQWQQAAGNHHTITFTEVPVGTIVTSQYESLGITFTDGNDVVRDLNFPDDRGLFGGWGSPQGIRMVFDAPIYSIGVHFAGRVSFELYSDGRIIYSSLSFGFSSTFAGLMSGHSFDEVRMIDPIDNAIYLDNIYFNVPGSSVLSIFALAGLSFRSRRRTR